jgi:hypothetical protein
MLVAEAKSYTAIDLNIDEDLDLIIQALVHERQERKPNDPKREQISAILEAIHRCNSKKDIYLRFS